MHGVRACLGEPLARFAARRPEVGAQVVLQRLTHPRRQQHLAWRRGRVRESYTCGCSWKQTVTLWTTALVRAAAADDHAPRRSRYSSREARVAAAASW